MLAANQSRKMIGIGERIVDAAEHYVFKRNKVARSHTQVAPAGGHQIAERMLFIDGHELVAQPIIGSMKTYSKRHRGSFCKLVDLAHKSRGRNGDAAA